MVRIVGKSDSFSVGVGLHQGCPLSPTLFIRFMDRISRRSQGTEGFQFGSVRISSRLYVDDMVLLVLSGGDLQLLLERFAAECEAARMRINISKSENMVLCWKRVKCLLQVGSEVLPQVKEFKYLGIDRWIGAACAVVRTLYRSVVVKRELSLKARLCLLVDLRSNPHLWSQTVGSDRKNEIVDTSG